MLLACLTIHTAKSALEAGRYRNNSNYTIFSLEIPIGFILRTLSLASVYYPHTIEQNNDRNNLVQYNTPSYPIRPRNLRKLTERNKTRRAMCLFALYETSDYYSI